MNDDMQFEIAKLTLKPGDVLVIRVPVWVKGPHEKRINDGMKELLAKAGHPDTQVLVLGPDVNLEILEHAA